MTAEQKLVFGDSIQSNKERGTRQVFHGTFDGEPAVIKLYTHPLRAWMHWKMCAVHGQVVRHRQIPAPDIWHSGYLASAKGYVIVYRWLPAPRDFRWIKAGELPFEEKLPGFQKLLSLFALMHQRGVAQSDTTPGNFIESEGTVYAIDEDRMNIRPWPLARKTSLENIASMLTQFAPLTPEQTHALYQHYSDARGWTLRQRDQRQLARSIARFQRWRADKKAFARQKRKQWLLYLAVGGVLLGGTAALLGLI